MTASRSEPPTAQAIDLHKNGDTWSSSAAASPPERRRICGYLVHPAADLLPEPSALQYEELKADIKKHGIKVPVVLVRNDWGESEILDGRSRARAWEELHPAGSFPDSVYIKGGIKDPIAYVLSLNVHRRHLRPDQVVAIYVLAEEMAAKGHVAPKRSQPGQARAAKIAKATKVGTRTVKRVLAVQKAAPERLKDIAKGTTSANKVLKADAPTKEPTPTIAQDEDLYKPLRVIKATNGTEIHIEAAAGFRDKNVSITVYHYDGQKKRQDRCVEIPKGQTLDEVISALIATVPESRRLKGERAAMLAAEAEAERVRRATWPCEAEHRLWCDDCEEIVDEPATKWQCSRDSCGEEFVSADRQCPSCNSTFSRRSDFDEDTGVCDRCENAIEEQTGFYCERGKDDCPEKGFHKIVVEADLPEEPKTPEMATEAPKNRQTKRGRAWQKAWSAKYKAHQEAVKAWKKTVAKLTKEATAKAEKAAWDAAQACGKPQA